MRRAAAILLVLGALVGLWLLIRRDRIAPTAGQTPLPATGRVAIAAVPAPSLTNETADAQRAVRELHERIAGFLLAVKDPYRPPLGDNRDITRALTGRNRRGLAMVASNEMTIVDEQIVDRWGTPYWFHARAPDAIDVVSAGPDRMLFTPDDLSAGGR
jgi:hypothetical protein